MTRLASGFTLALLLLSALAGVIVISAPSIPPASATGATWYHFGTYHGIANSISITEPSYTLEIANGTQFDMGGSYDPFSLNYTRTPTVDVCATSIGAIGAACFWTEYIACGCGADQPQSSGTTRYWHVKYANNNLLEVQYNNTNTGYQPRDNYTMLFYYNSNWFVWNIQEKIVSGRSGAYNTGWNGFGSAVSWAVSSPITTVVLSDTGLITSSSTINFFLSTAWEAQHQEYEFSGVTSGGNANASIYEYPVSGSTPYSTCGASNNGEMKCAEVPGPPQGGGGYTFAVGWTTSTTFVIYATYNDKGSSETNALALASSLYLSSYGKGVGFSGWLLSTSLYCNASQPGGNTAQGCGSYNTLTPGPMAVSNSYSWYRQGQVGQWLFWNQTIMQQGNRLASSFDSVGFNTLGPGYEQNEITNSTGTFLGSAAVDSQSQAGGSTYAYSVVSQRDVSGEITVVMPPTGNRYIVEVNSSIVHSTQITTLLYSISLPGPTTGCDTTENEGSSNVVQINSTTWEYEYQDSVTGNWVGYTIGVYGNSNGAGVSFVTYSNACHDHYVVILYLLNNGSPTTYNSGSWGESVYVLPHFGQLTTVAQIDAKQKATVTMTKQKQLDVKPLSLASTAEPLALETASSWSPLFYSNSTATGYNVVMVMHSGTYTMYFLWSNTIGGTLYGVTGSTSWSQAALSGGWYNVTVTWTAASNSKTLFFLTQSSTTVTQPIILTAIEGGPQTLTISGCSPSPSTVTGNGVSQSITMSQNCPFTLVGSTGSGLRWGFISGTTFSYSSASLGPTCSSGTCTTISLGFDTQAQLTVTGGSSLSYTKTSETLDGWYKTPDTLTVSSAGIWGRSSGTGYRITSWQIDSGTPNVIATASTVTTSVISMTGSHTVTFTQATQYQLTLSVSPSGSGTATTTTGPSITGDTGWYDSATSITLAESARGSTFSAWTCTGSGCYSGSLASPSFTILGPTAETAIFVLTTTTTTTTSTASTVLIVIKTSPDVLTNALTIDGVSYTGTQSFNWAVGTYHTLAAASTVYQNPLVTVSFVKWSNGGTRTQTFQVTGSLILTAYFSSSSGVNQCYGNPVQQLEKNCIVPAIILTWSAPMGMGPWFAFMTLGVNVAVYNKSQSIVMALITLLTAGAVFGLLLPTYVGSISNIFLILGTAGLFTKLILLAR